MANIRFTFQRPDDAEAREMPADEDVNEKETDSMIAKKRSIRERGSNGGGRSILPATTSPPRRGSTMPPTTLGPDSDLVHHRKFSFPTNLPSNFLGLESTGTYARRRFSNVSDAVTRKLSSTIGWKSLGQKQCREIVSVGKSLCGQYIRNRLKRSGYLNKKCNLQVVRSPVSLGGLVFREVYPELLGLGMELERLHPKLYANVSRQASAFPGGRLNSEKEVGAILTAVSRELLKNEITWGKVVSLYAVAGGLAVDCVRQGHHNYLVSIVETMEDILEDDLAQWIQSRGGWCALSAMVRPPTSNWPFLKVFLFIFAFFFVTIFIVFVFSLFGISAFL